METNRDPKAQSQVEITTFFKFLHLLVATLLESSMECDDQARDTDCLKDNEVSIFKICKTKSVGQFLA